MQGPPLEFKMKPDAKPYAVYSPATVPAHWAKKVKEDIDRDLWLGVLEKLSQTYTVGLMIGATGWCWEENITGTRGEL